MLDLRLTPNFTLAELVHSETAVRKGLLNVPTAAVITNLKTVLAPGMQRIRDLLASPIAVSSGYRSPAVNKAIGGSATSQHTRGEACDFTAPGYGTPLQVCRAIVANKSKIGFDQLIFEGTWVHVSFVAAGARGQVLTAHFGGGGVRYTPGLPPL